MLGGVHSGIPDLQALMNETCVSTLEIQMTMMHINIEAQGELVACG